MGIWNFQNQVFKRFLFTSFLLTSIFFISCTNNININSSLTPLNQGITQPNAGNIGNGTGVFTLSRVSISAHNRDQAQFNQFGGKVLDLVGDGSGAIGSFCQQATNAKGAEGGNAAQTVCECSFSFKTPTGASQQIFSEVLYKETNLLRCAYATVPAGVASMQVSVHITSSDTFSTAVNFNLNSSGVTLDTTDLNSFSLISRYQCRDSIFIPYLFDSSMYDPIQSEDSHLTFPLNYYTVNLGGTLSQYVANPQAIASAGSVTIPDCPNILTPSNYLTTPALISYYSATHYLNMNIYSISPDSSGSKMIFPPPPAGGGSFDRSTFYLAKQATGAFQTKVNAYIAPNIVQTLGFGVSPIPSGINGQESCPDASTPKPAGYHWVKLWLFRSSLLPRKYISGMGNAISMVCNPGNWPPNPSGTSTYSAIFNDACPDSNFTSAPPAAANYYVPATKSRSMQDITPFVATTSYLADRVMQIDQNKMCIRLDDAAIGAATTTYCSSTFSGPSCDIAGAEGMDRWETYRDIALTPPAAQPAIPNWSNAACNSNPAIDPFQICTTQSSGFSAKTPIVPNTRFSLTNLDSGVYDYIFVVTPPSITVSGMQAVDSTSLPYQPYRFKTFQDCQSTDPDNQPCPLAQKISYGLKLHDVSQNEDPTGTDPGRAGQFPVCALQPDS